MRVFTIAVLTALAVPANALASEPALVTQELPLRGARTLQAAAPTRFDLVGLHWQGTGRVLFRTRARGGAWSAWHTALPEPEDLPDAGTAEAARRRGWRLGNPFWTGPSSQLAYRTVGDVRRIRAHFVSSAADSAPARAVSIAAAPRIILRAAWGANEQIRRAAPRYAAAVRFAVVHHTAGANDYTQAQSAAIVRAIQVYHVRGNGWDDIGYNFLVDKYGQVFEGRYGGIERPVIGAHAGGFNNGSTGVALLGNYNGTAPSARAQSALSQLLAWRLDVAHVDPLSSLNWLSAGNARFPVGTPVLLRAVSGHRDTGFTDCPGNILYARLGSIARAASGFGLPKLYDPAARGRLGAPIRFTARLSAPLPWTVTVADERGTTVASGTGTGTQVDWSWDATALSTGTFTWAIEAPGVRPARGRIGSTAATLTITQARARPQTITPNGDSRADSTTISYVLSRPATVTATLQDLSGATISTLFTGPRPAGPNSFRFAASGVPDGAFVIVLTARATNGREVRVSVPVVVDRTLAGFEASPEAFSPNGDGRLDRIRFRFVLSYRSEATLRVYRARTLVATPASGLLDPGSHELEWDGRGQRGRVRDGALRAVISVDGPLGTRVQETRFRLDTTRPRLRLLSLRALRFVVSEPVELTVVVNGRQRIVQAAPRGVVTVRAASAVRRVSAVAVDAAANRSRVLRAP